MTRPWIPTELIELIASHVDLQTFRSLRLTNVELSRQTAYYLRNQFLRKQHLAWSRESLDRFVEINTHAVFAGAMQHLVIDATPYHAIALLEVNERITVERLSLAQYRYPHNPSSELLKQQTDARNAAARAVRDAKFFNEAGYDLKCLVSVFKRLERLESVTFEYGRRECEYSKFVSRSSEYNLAEMSRPFLSTMAAIAETKLPVYSILRNRQSGFGAMTMGRFESLAPSLGNFDAAFEKLSTMQLSLRGWREPDDSFALNETTRASFLVCFLSKAKNVQHLYLNGCSHFESIARHCQFTKLKSCVLSTFPTNFGSDNDLENFLIPCSNTLVDLSLHGLLLPGDGDRWPMLLAELAGSKKVLQALEVLTLKDLFTTGGYIVYGARTGYINEARGNSLVDERAVPLPIPGIPYGERGSVGGEWREEVETGLHQNDSYEGSRAEWLNMVRGQFGSQ
ncbi:f-box domain containing [Pyrenophora seminiperda CCB06]|uniref:F-box domain containing n=1 Tax=Pyrenophora seminiperda CCB06 TaxID=1302712 RepID=A0A3M7MG41_9PLEO|nr:f-box domain containing [Pyrenophora seminiperda CCB06]